MIWPFGVNETFQLLANIFIGSASEPGKVLSLIVIRAGKHNQAICPAPSQSVPILGEMFE